ncbi:MAG: sigma factor-like helix-turn-helix DNA-binding protein [Sphingobacteriales bacterium]
MLWIKREGISSNINLAAIWLLLYGTGHSTCLYRHVESRYIELLKDYLETYVSAPADHLAREHELSAYIGGAIDKLPGKMRTIFEMSRKENRLYREIADQLGVSKNNVSKQVNNALHILKAKPG